MAGTNNHGALMEDWMLPTPSPRTLMSSFLNEEFSSGPLSDIFGDNGSNKPQDRIEKSKAFVDSSREETAQVTNAPFQFESNLFGANQKSGSHQFQKKKSGSHGGLAERMAARTGFAVLKIDTSRVSSSAPIRSPVAIPPGVSPREFLESPVFLPNAIAQASPTTGKLPFFMPPNVNSTILSVPKKAEDRLRDDCVFSFQPVLRSEAPNFSIADKGFSVHQNQSSANNNQQELSLQSSSTATNDVTEATIVKPKTSDPMLENDHPSPADEREESEANQNGEYSSAPLIAPAEDGYNWRKYGQKQVKNSEHPRSYYKCTHPNCCVKKKVERSQDGHITEIVYKGSHSHPLPLPNCRPSGPFSHFNDLQADGSEKFGPMPALNAETSRENAPNGHFQDVHGGVTETKMYASLNTAELADTSVMEPREAVDVSSTLSNEDDRATHGTISLGCEGNEDETESKRRKMDISAATTTTTSTIDMGALASRAVREPRVVVQTTSEVDILDDGYRWRKYGQKVVKGNPNPRSYYKCTHPGCSVRKHVERASHDLKSVITTYEGKHNHEVPAARNSGRPSSGSGIVTLAAQQANGHHRRPEPAQGSLAQFGSAAAYGSQFGSAAAYGSQFGSAAAYGSIGTLPRDQIVAAAGGFSFSMLPHGMAVPVPSLGTVMPAQMAGHPPAMQGYPRLVLPTEEVKVNPVARSGLPVANGTAEAAYQQLMGRLSQGPQM